MDQSEEKIGSASSRHDRALVLALGFCPVLAAPARTFPALILGIACAAILLCSTIPLLLLGKAVPDAITSPFILVVTAFFTAVAAILVHICAAVEYAAVKTFFPLLAVSALLLFRYGGPYGEEKLSRALASGLHLSALYLGLSFLMGSIREILGSASWFGVELPFLMNSRISVLARTPGAFLLLGLLLAIPGLGRAGAVSVKGSEKE